MRGLFAVAAVIAARACADNSAREENLIIREVPVESAFARQPFAEPVMMASPIYADPLYQP